MLLAVVGCLLGGPAAAEDPYEIVWTRQFGSAFDDGSSGVAVDGAGAVYICGRTEGSLGGPIAGPLDAYVAKFDPSGNRLWTRQFGASGSDHSSAVAVDSGAVYTCGWTDGDLGGPGAGERDAYLAKLDANGEALWTRQLGTSADDWATGLAVDSAGAVYISGNTEGDLGGPGAGDLDAFLAKYDASGALLWTRQFGSAGRDTASGVAVNSAGAVYITGGTEGDACLAKYDTSGELLWTRQLGTSTSDSGLAVAVDGAEAVYMGGRTFGDLGGASAGFYDAFLAKYDTSGSLLWTRQLGSTAWDQTAGVAVDSGGAVYIAGWWDFSLLRPSGSPTGIRAFLAKYDPSGARLWSRQLGHAASSANGVAVDSAGAVYVTRSAFREISPMVWVTDALLAKLACPADCDGDGNLTLFDFLCFQNTFAAGTARADCDGNSVLDVFDFLCFQDTFVAGCP